MPRSKPVKHLLANGPLSFPGVSPVFNTAAHHHFTADADNGRATTSPTFRSEAAPAATASHCGNFSAHNCVTAGSIFHSRLLDLAFHHSVAASIIATTPSASTNPVLCFHLTRQV